MFDNSELTVVKNSVGMPTALGYPVNSALLQNNNPLFVGGGGKASMAVPAGLVCMTETICTNANGMVPNANGVGAADPYREDDEVIPDGLYERLLELAEVKEKKKMTKKQKPKTNTHKTKANTKKHKK